MHRLIILAALAGAMAHGQTVTINDTIRTAVGNGLFSGTITVTLNNPHRAQPLYSGSVTLAGWQQTVTVVDGVFSLTLYANDQITPSGTSYTATYSPNSGKGGSETWVVPSGATTIREIRANTVPTPATMFTPSQITQAGATLNQFLVWDGSKWGPSTNLAGNAATATALQTPRTIAGVSFNGTANIAIPSTGLSDTAQLIRNNAANTYTAGAKQTFTSNATTAGAAFGGGITADPSSVTAGDFWYRADLGTFGFRNATAVDALVAGGRNLTTVRAVPFVTASGRLTQDSTIRTDNIPRATKLRNWIPPQFNQRRVMASPPSTTFTTSATIPSPRSWMSVSYTNVSAQEVVYNRSGSPAQLGTLFPDWMFIGFNATTSTSGSRVRLMSAVSFMHYGSAVELFMKGITGNFLVKVNDEYISASPQNVPNDGSGYYYYINFASAAMRRIEFIGYNTAWGGLLTAQTDSVSPAPIRGPRTIIVGDSFTEGTGGGNTGGWPQWFADAMGWDDVWPSAAGGTGYLAAPDNKRTFRQRIAADVYAYSPDIVIIAGGRNDTSFSAAAVGAEAQLLFADIRANLPNALLIVTSPFWQAGPQSYNGNTLLAMRDAIRTAATNNGALFVDVLEMPLADGLPMGTATLHANAAAGAGTFQLVTATSTVRTNSVIQFANGERYWVRSASGSPITITIDGTLATAKTAGEAITQVGNSFWVGTGRVGATSGYGNADIFVSSDGTHPTAAGHAALGYEVARQVANLLR